MKDVTKIIYGARGMCSMGYLDSVTIEDCYLLDTYGYEIVIEDGHITRIKSKNAKG